MGQYVCSFIDNDGSGGLKSALISDWSRELCMVTSMVES